MNYVRFKKKMKYLKRHIRELKNQRYRFDVLEERAITPSQIAFAKYNREKIDQKIKTLEWGIHKNKKLIKWNNLSWKR